jgi:hypothetical protein
MTTTLQPQLRQRPKLKCPYLDSETIYRQSTSFLDNATQISRDETTIGTMPWWSGNGHPGTTAKFIQT